MQALEPGGLILVHDFFLNDSLDGPLFPALFSMNMLLNNHGRSYSEKEVSALMQQAGARAFSGCNLRAPMILQYSAGQPEHNTVLVY
jgi:hypothetical protein